MAHYVGFVSNLHSQPSHDCVYVEMDAPDFDRRLKLKVRNTKEFDADLSLLLSALIHQLRTKIEVTEVPVEGRDLPELVVYDITIYRFG